RSCRNKRQASNDQDAAGVQMTFHDAQRQDEASRIRAQLEALEIERLRLEARLREIESEQEPSPPISLAATVTNGSPAADKVALFRKLFAGRTDVFPARWENPKSGRSGYAPACANEWVRGVCGKPQVRCGECPPSRLGSAAIVSVVSADALNSRS